MHVCNSPLKLDRERSMLIKSGVTPAMVLLLLAEIIQEAELPAGVVNIITGAGATGAALSSHPDVDKVAFTVSTEGGKRIQRALAGTRKKLTPALGAKAPNLDSEAAPIVKASD